MTATVRAGEWPVWQVWSLLVSATIVGVLLADGLAPARIATSLAFVLAAVKIRVVFTQYMELDRHHRPLNLLLDAWLLVVSAILIISYWLT